MWQFSEHLEYASLEPWHTDEEKADWRAASIIWHMRDVLRMYAEMWGAKNAPKPDPIKSYKLTWSTSAESGVKKTWQQMKAIAYQWATVFNRKPK